ncbi:unnamed protein product [Cylicocyclus nassatus]|uniref:Little elongation complex subunit 2 C-terminal domain-containing protein n=1 Tax=Cylicocyclus nassatus TaxID=53992 RepID=A0AA36H567_CYLNA|nr:unnamed protein product [Cylicocyclus nassatus]
MCSTEASSITCKVLEKLIEDEDALGVATHSPNVCVTCMRKLLLEQFGGKELLFPNEPPPWYKPPEASVQESPTSTKDQEKESSRKLKKRGKQDTKMVIPKEEIDDYLLKLSIGISDGKLRYEIMKHKKVSKDAAQKLMIEIRRRAKKERLEMPDEDHKGKSEVVNPRENLPWCPSTKDLFPRGLLSKLSQEEQQRFLAICQSIMNTGEIRFVNNLKELTHFQKEAQEERDNIENLVIETIENSLEGDAASAHSHPLQYNHQMASEFILKRWEKRWHNDKFKTQFASSTPQCSIDWNIRDIRADPEIRPILTATLLKGRIDRIQLPSLRNRCSLDTSKLYTLYPPEECDANQIFDDLETVTSLCLENDVRIAMDATTACHLMSDPFAGHDYTYVVPIRVVEKMVQGTMTNIAVMGKPRILETVDRTTVQRQFAKYLLKSNYIQKKAEVPPVPATNEPVAKDSTPLENKKSDFCDPLDSILPSLDAPLNHLEPVVANHSENGKSYAIFSITGTNILVRSRPAPLCSEGHQSMKGATLSLQPRMEYVPNAGAMRLSEAEAVWNYSKGIFKQSANHGLFRTHFMGKYLLQLQHWNAQNVTVATGSEQLWTGPTTRLEAKRMIAAYTLRFAKVLQEIGHLPHGDFMLLNRNDGFIKIVPEATAETADINYDDVTLSVNDVILHIRNAFAGLESMIPLQWQIMQKRAPGCYVAKDSNLKKRAMMEEHTPSRKPVNMKLTHNQRRNRKRKKMKWQNARGRSVQEPTVEMDSEPVYCPFGSPTNASSPACSEPSLSSCPSPELVIDVPEEHEE